VTRHHVHWWVSQMPVSQRDRKLRQHLFNPVPSDIAAVQ
jgi:hypothetical protein